MLLLGTYVPVTGGYQKTKERNEYDKCLWVIEQRQRRLLCLIWNDRYESKCLYFWCQTWRKCYDVSKYYLYGATNDKQWEEDATIYDRYTWWQVERRKKTSYDDTDFMTPPFIATLSDRRHTPTTTTKEGSGDCREQEGRIDRSISEQRGPTLSRARPTINKK